MRVSHIFCLLTLVVTASREGILASESLQENGDGGPAIRAVLRGPSALTFDRMGNLYIVETTGHRVRKVDATTRVITTVAGNGRSCCFREGKEATSVALRYPFAVAVDDEQNVFVADSIARVYRVDSKTGVLTSLLRQTGAFRPDPGDSAHLADREQISGLAVGPLDGTTNGLYVLSHTGQVYAIQAGSLSTVFGEGQGAYDRDVGQLHSPSGITIDGSGNIFLADHGSCRIFRVDPKSRALSPFAGTGECKPANSEAVSANVPVGNLVGVAVDSRGDIYFIADAPFCLGRVDAMSKLTLAIDRLCDSEGQRKWIPSGLTVDGEGNIYFTIWGSNVVRRVDARTHMITTAAGVEYSTRVGPRH